MIFKLFIIVSKKSIKNFKKIYPTKMPKFLMLEVLIAVILLITCMMPLISPHIFMIRSRREAINLVKTHHFINELYAEVLEKMHRNEIHLNDIENKKIFSLPETFNGYLVKYHLFQIKAKDRNSDGVSVHKAVLQIELTKQKTNEILTFDYPVFFGSKIEPQNQSQSNEPTNNTNDQT